LTAGVRALAQDTPTDLARAPGSARSRRTGRIERAQSDGESSDCRALKEPDVLNALLSLCDLPRSRLTIIGLANHVDLYSRFAQGAPGNATDQAETSTRLDEACRATAVVFKPYSSE